MVLTDFSLRGALEACLSLQRLGVGLPVTRPAWDSNLGPPASEIGIGATPECRRPLAVAILLVVMRLAGPENYADAFLLFSANAAMCENLRKLRKDRSREHHKERFSSAAILSVVVRILVVASQW